MHQPIEGVDNPVKFVRLNTGEDIITEVVMIHDEESHYLFVNPLKVVYNLGKRPDSIVLAFSPWVFSSVCDKQEFPIFPNDVVTIADPTEAIVDCYWEFVDKMAEARSNTEMYKPQERTETEPKQSAADMITEEEEEFLKSVLETIQHDPKRRLH